MHFDIHVHTTLSPCSCLTLPQILNQARDKGLHGVCITDHDTMSVRKSLREGIQDDGLCVIFGVEYATEAGDFLLFGPFDNLPAGLPARKVLMHAENVRGAAIAAHPFRQGRSTDKRLIEQGLCRIVEGINGRNLPTENIKTAEWAQRYGIKLAGGSDAHSIDELGRIATRFHTEIKTRKDLILALRNGDFSLAPGSITNFSASNALREAALCQAD